MLNSFTFAGICSLNYQAYAFGAGTYTPPEKKVERVEVPGRSGAVIFEQDAWNDVDVTYQVIIMHDFRRNYLKFKADFFAMSHAVYYELYDTFHPEIYRKGVIKKITAPKMSDDYDAGVFTVIFECKAQMYLREGTQRISEAAAIQNDTGFTAYPLITIEGSGSFEIGSHAVVVANHTGDIIYDAELNEAYGENGENMNGYITLMNGIPVLHTGTNGITVNGVVLEIDARRFIV